ncbi:unnamed protein product, partial [Porites evermanni]
VRQSCFSWRDRFGRCQDVGLGGRRWEKGHKLDSNQVTIFLIALHGGSIVAVVTFEATKSIKDVIQKDGLQKPTVCMRTNPQ